MIRIIAISDTHGMNSYIEREINRIGENNINAIIHAGDYVSDADKLYNLFPRIPMYNVAGNNDLYSHAKGEELAVIGGVKIFITHGHSYGVKYDSDLRSLIQRAQTLGADMVVYGHTHISDITYFGGMTVLNPGSAGYSHSYAVIEIENKHAKASIIQETF